MDSFPDERVVRFNARGPDALIDGKAPGPRPKLNDARRLWRSWRADRSLRSMELCAGD